MIINHPAKVNVLPLQSSDSFPDIKLSKPFKLGKGGHPRILSLCAERLERYYNRPGMVIPALNLAKTQYKSKASNRQMYLQRRKAVCQLLSAALLYTDVSTLEIKPYANASSSPTVAWLAGIAQLPIRRAQRALRDIKAAGLMQIKQVRVMNADGSYSSRSAIKRLSRNLFRCLGLGEMLKKSIRYLTKQDTKSKESMTDAKSARFEMGLKGALNKINSTSTKFRPKPNQRLTEDAMSFEENKAFSLHYLSLKIENPGLSKDELIRLAKR